MESQKPEGGQLTAAARARLAIVRRPHVRISLWYLGLGLGAGGLVFALDGAWILAAIAVLVGAAVLWFVGAWVIPHSRDAYVRRLTRIWRQWVLDTQGSYDRFIQGQAKFVSDLRSLSPPAAYVTSHERLVHLEDAQDQLRRKRSRDPTNAHAVAETEAQARALREMLARRANTDEKRAYIASLNRLFTDRAAKYDRTAELVEQATTNAIETLRKMRAPVVAAEKHQTLVVAFEAHLRAVQAWHQAAKTAEPDQVETAAGEWTATAQELFDCLRRDADRVGHYERWPNLAPQK